VTHAGAKQTFAIWLVTVLAVWMAATGLLVILDGVRLGHHAGGGLVLHAVASAAALCIVACGPPTAVVLWLRQRHSGAQSALGGLAAAVLAFVLVFVIALHSGLASLTAVAPVAAALAAEFAVALKLRTASVRRLV
jgi:hypothetical protein